MLCVFFLPPETGFGITDTECVTSALELMPPNMKFFTARPEFKAASMEFIPANMNILPAKLLIKAEYMEFSPASIEPIPEKMVFYASDVKLSPVKLELEAVKLLNRYLYAKKERFARVRDCSPRMVGALPVRVSLRNTHLAKRVGFL